MPEIIIVGGGVHGLSIAYHLANLGFREVMIIEKNRVGAGASSRGPAGVRHQFGTELNCRMAIENVKSYSSLTEELDVGIDIEFYRGGYLLPAHSERQLDQFRKNVALQNSLGIPSAILGPEEVGKIAPLLSLENVVGGSYCPRDGHVNPLKVLAAYRKACERLGITIMEGEPVRSVLVEKGKACGVVTASRTLHSEAVVVAAGPWSKQVLAGTGVDLPITPQRRQAFVTEPLDHVLDPLILCYSDGTYWKQTLDGQFFVGLGGEGEPCHCEASSSWEFALAASDCISRHMPALEGVSVMRQWSGTYDLTPDGQAILGPVEAVQGLFLDCGWSGHGFQFAPTAGRVVAEMVAGKEPFIDVRRLALERFERGELMPEPVAAI